MTTFASLRTAIKSKLDSLVYNNPANLSGVLMQVKDYHDETFTGFPAVTFEPSGNENAFFTNTDNERAYAFDIYVWQEIPKGGRDQAIDSLTAAVDAIMAAFDGDFNLSGACDSCVPIPSSWGEVIIGGGSFKYAKMTLVCRNEETV